MRRRTREIIEERMEILISSALQMARDDPGLAGRHAEMARNLSTRHRIRMPYRLRMVFCKKCKSFIAPGINARFRLGQNPRGIRITCRICGHTYRKLI